MSDSFVDPDKAMKICEQLMVRWASLLDRLSDYDGPPREAEES